MIDQKTTGITDIQLENSKTVVSGMVAGARQAYKAGLTVGVGTDTDMTFVSQYATWREPALLVRFAGFTPAQAIHAATQVNARILGVDDVAGSLEAGKSADLLVVDGDPLKDLRTLERPALVVVAGHPVFRPKTEQFLEINELLDSVIS